MKKLLSLFISFILLIPLGVVAHADGFYDLPEDHWAYQNVMTLVGDGTVNGYEDGSFRPSATVTRAEFVKMLGKWDKAYDGTFSDLSSEHWGYEFIMWSGLESTDGKVYPDREMLRSDVVNLIWKRNGSPENDDAPYAISKQGTNRNAVSWGYTIGLVQGDDGYNLHLDRPLTRAEAATLIIRSRSAVAENQQHSFREVVSEDLLRQVFNSMALFPNRTFEKDAAVTYGELARAVMTLGAGGQSISYDNSGLDTTDLFEHEYTKDLYVAAHKVWGETYYTPEKAEQNATVQDALSGLVYGLLRRGGKTVNLGKTDVFYSDCAGATDTVMENLCLSYAADNGIKLFAGTLLGAEREVTSGDIAAFLLQLNETAGLELGYAGSSVYNVKSSSDLSLYPENYADYRIIAEGVPTAVYNLKRESTKPVNDYKTANQLSFVYAAYLGEVQNVLKNEQNVGVSFMLYPSLMYEENNREVFIAKCTAVSGAIDIDSAFSKFLKVQTGLTVKQNQEFFVAFETYEPLLDVYLPYTGAYVKSIIIPD